MNVFRSIRLAVILLSLIGCGTAFQASATSAVQNEQGSRYVVQLQRSPDAACTQCHKSQTDTLHGKHSNVLNPNNKLPVTCTNCHGNASAAHREGVKDVMRFNADIFNANKAMYRVEEQNNVCFSCHRPEELRDAFWVHDVHAMKISCNSCHQLHPEKDPMQGIAAKSRVKLCVDCHSRQQSLMELKNNE